MKKLLQLTISLILSFFLNAQITTPVIKAGFGVDADLRANYFNGNIQFNDDWFANGTAGTGQAVIDSTGAAAMVSRYLVDPAFRKLPFFRTMRVPQFSIVNNRLWIDAVYIRDYNGQSGGDSTAFLISNKNADSPADWNGGATSVLDKNDIGEMMIHVKRAGPTKTDSLWFMGGMSLQGTTGNRYFDFELYQTDIFFSRATGKFSNYGPDAGHTSWKLDAAGNIIAPGDVIFTAEYSSSSLTAIEARVWVDKNTMNITPVSFDWIGDFVGASSGSQFGYANIRPKITGTYYTGLQSGNNTWAGPFGFIDGGNNYLTTYSARQYMEFSINLSKLGLDPITLLGGNACGLPFRRILVKTRTSTSFSSELKDFIGPFDFFVTAPVKAQAELPLFCGVIGVSEIHVQNPLPASVYTWSTPDGHIVGDSVGTSIQADAPGTYIVSQQLLDGCSTTSKDTVTIVFDASCSPLVTGITAFKGTIEDKKASLTWTTQENDIVSAFELQRSTNGTNFQSVKFINATDKYSSYKTYVNINDVSDLKTAIVFYRLKIHYAKENSSYSQIIKLNNEVAVSIYPNPSNKYIQINISSSSKGEAIICAYDLSGKSLYKIRITTNEGQTQHTIKEVESWSPGIYMVSIKAGGKQQWHKIIVTHPKKGSNYLNTRSF